MSRTDRTLRLAKKVVSSAYRQNMVAIITKGNKVVVSSLNNMNKTHPASFNGDYSRCIHAEISAIHRAANASGTIGTDIYIWRFLKSGVLGNSKPCKNCMDAIKKAKIRCMTYYHNGEILTEKVADVLSI